MQRFSAFRLCVAAFALGLLAGCGFEPLLATGRGVDAPAQLAQIQIEQVPNRSGQILRKYVTDRLAPLGPSARPAYTLSIRLNEPREILALRRDDVISRGGYSASVQFELRDRAGNRLTTGVSSYSTDYEVTISEYATLVSREDARDRVLELIGDNVANQLAEYFRDRVAARP